MKNDGIEQKALHASLEGARPLPRTDTPRLFNAPAPVTLQRVLEGETYKPDPTTASQEADDDRIAVFGWSMLRLPARADQPEIECARYWVSRWFQALMIGLVGAVVVLACDVALGWAGRVIAFVGRLFAKVLGTLGML